MFVSPGIPPNSIYSSSNSFLSVFLYEYKKIDKRDLLDEYMQYGGMPGLINIDNDEDKKAYLNNLYNEIYIKDLVEHGKIRREEHDQTDGGSAGWGL